ncbi:MAG: ATP-binding protein [Erythrobacter sp.]
MSVVPGGAAALFVPNRPDARREGDAPTPSTESPDGPDARSDAATQVVTVQGQGSRLIAPFHWLCHGRIAIGPLDGHSLSAALLGGLAYLALAWLSRLLGDPAAPISSVWLPNAVAVAALLCARLRSELPFLAACFAASLAVNAAAQLPDHVALLFALANLAEIVLVLALTRTALGQSPRMDRLGDLARFVWAGGLVGPLASGLMCIPVLGANWVEIRAGVMAWFLTESMAMLLIVPAVLLVVDRMAGRLPRAPASPWESVALLGGGMAIACLVFNQTHYPLLFLIQPVTLLHAFRLGSLGSALNVGGVAVAAGVMTWAGQGPIAASDTGAISQLHLLQAFIAANFLTGLPVAAILAGRERMTARLAAGKREVDLLANNVSDAILLFDLAGVCTYASPSVHEIMGEPSEAYLGNHVSARLRPDAQDRALQAMARLLGGASERERVTYRRLRDSAEGAPVFLEADCAVVRCPQSGAREGVVVAARDATERVELELLLTRARRQAEDAARVKSEFLANMSHEIRTPMNSVLGFTELMLQGELAYDQRRFAELIVQSGRSMMMMLNDVLDLSKIESGQFAIDCAPVDLHASLAECVALHRPAASRKGLELELILAAEEAETARRAAGAPSLWVVTDGLRLRQILLNLISNAVKFTDVGHIRIGYRIIGQELHVSVADSGIGISPLQLEAIFQPFTQGQPDAARRFAGTGLGLSISRQLASLLGGRIEVESAPGEGSRFTLVLPAALAPPGHDAAPAATRLPPGLPAQPLAPSRILLVEDHDIGRVLVQEMLQRCGQDVDLAHDGNEAIALVIDSIMRGRPYDLVLMDVQMPGCDGLEATRAIRADGIGPGLLPVIALTANAYPEDVAAARAAGMQAHLAKPVVFAQLARALLRWLPTRIVEAQEAEQALPGGRAADPAARASQLARSPRLVARWQARRAEALAAVEAAVAQGWMAGEQPPAGAPQSELARLLHKLAGTAALFGEPALGAAAAALERALAEDATGTACAALAAALLETGQEEATDPRACAAQP